MDRDPIGRFSMANEDFRVSDTNVANVSSASVMKYDDTIDSLVLKNDNDEDESDNDSLLSDSQDLLGDIAKSSPQPPVVPSRPGSPPFAKPKPDIVSKQFSRFRELEALLSLPVIAEPKAVIVLAPNCYSHEFKRPWVGKRYLSSIVERPERLNAAALGIGSARTVSPIKVVECQKQTSLYCPHFNKVHGEDWATELYALCSQAASKHAKNELEVPESWPSGDIYLAEGTIRALEGAIGAVETGVDEIYNRDTPATKAFVAVRPPGHHCHEDAASGFCVINNAHIAIQYAHAKHEVTHAVILDFDLHHGDGSQDLVWKLGFKTDGPAEIPIGYFSIHDINSFPCEQGYADPEKLTAASVCLLAHNTAVWNVHLATYQTNEEFDKLYETKYSVLFEKASEFLEQSKLQWESKPHRQSRPFNPLIVISAGFDGSEYESQGMQRHKVHVPTSFFNRFTRDGVALANHYAHGHLLSLLEGGYSTPAIATGVFSHITGLCDQAYKPEWCPPEIAKEFERASKSRWKNIAKGHQTWPGAETGILLGRALFPRPDPDPETLPHSETRQLRSNRSTP